MDRHELFRSLQNFDIGGFVIYFAYIFLLFVAIKFYDQIKKLFYRFFSYPHTFECSSCSAQTTIEWADARDMYSERTSFSKNFDSYDAMRLVLRDRGWLLDEVSGFFCPNCAENEAANK